jgi:hypothetical protein
MLSAEAALANFSDIGATMRSMTKDAYLTMQLSAICLLLYLDAMAVLARHPEWFQ